MDCDSVSTKIGVPDLAKLCKRSNARRDMEASERKSRCEIVRDHCYHFLLSVWTKNFRVTVRALYLAERYDLPKPTEKTKQALPIDFWKDPFYQQLSTPLREELLFAALYSLEDCCTCESDGHPEDLSKNPAAHRAWAIDLDAAPVASSNANDDEPDVEATDETSKEDATGEDVGDMFADLKEKKKSKKVVAEGAEEDAEEGAAEAAAPTEAFDFNSEHRHRTRVHPVPQFHLPTPQGESSA
ncbi:hypothetical protein HKX48_006135 [Thoreauomyces humboldtii]|nr:hypothetical protein HKX48_006135 [Thoreauomyces humboldtii]